LNIYPSRVRNILLTIILLAAGSALASAASVSGTVTNGTQGKPAAGDEVVLIKLSSGMEEVGHTKTNAEGKFTFNVQEANSPYLVRAIHQEVTYHVPAPPGTNSVDVTVYDVAPKVEGVRAVADLMYLQAGQGSLGVTRVFAVDNNSKPPRTEMNDAPFEFYVPEGAQIDQAQAQTAGGEPLNVSPTPQAQKNRYSFDFPLRPGQTQFQVTYHVPYSGKATIDPRLIYPLQHFVVILPKSISFNAAQSGIYENKQAPNQPDAIAEIASSPQPGQRLEFDISGEGTLQGQDQEASNGSAGDSRPGGGLGAPIEAPDPLDKYRGYILGGFGVVLVAGAIYMVNRSRSQQVSPAAAPAAVSTGNKLLDGLKEELFQLEMEHKRGQISDEEYTRTKSALDQTLTRAIKRSQSS
jgi:hypothetical protein